MPTAEKQAKYAEKWKADRTRHELQKMDKNKREIQKIQIELGLRDFSDATLVWLDRRGVV